MIGTVSGKLVEINGNTLIIENGAIGFEIIVSHPESYVIGNTYRFYIYESRKEDELTLYGFPARKEKEVFELLVRKVSGVGVRTALAVLSRMTVEKFVENIKTGNYSAFRSVPGIGEKMAKKLVLELGGDIDSLISEKFTGVKEQAATALENLGFSKEKVAKVLSEIGGSLPLEELLREALKRLGNG